MEHAFSVAVVPYADANGLRLYYEQDGAGPDLVLLNGLAADLLAWDGQRSAFAAHFRVTMFDNRGAGRSDAPDGPYTTSMMAADTTALLGALGIERAHLLGTSLGGMIAQELAIEHPDKVDRLVLACTRGKSSRLRYMLSPGFDRLWQSADAGEISRVDRVLTTLPWAMSPAFMSDEAKVISALEGSKAERHPMSLAAYRSQSAASTNHDASARLSRITAPTLVLVGAEDILTPVAEARELAEAIPNATLRVLPRGAHAFFHEYAQDVNSAVLDFLC